MAALGKSVGQAVSFSFILNNVRAILFGTVCRSERPENRFFGAISTPAFVLWQDRGPEQPN
jgi:hypothetical protein